jgi:hypothetical protein
MSRRGHVTQVSSLVRRVADVVGSVFSRLAAIVIGFLLMTLGLAMTATIVMLPVGLAVGLLGVVIVVGGFFAPDDRAERVDR